MVQLDFNFEAILKLQLTQSWYLCRSPELIIILFFLLSLLLTCIDKLWYLCRSPELIHSVKKEKQFGLQFFFAFLKKTAAWTVYNTAGCKLVTPFKKY